MHAQKYLEASLGALKLNKQRAIFICKDESHLPKDLPENIFWLPHCPVGKNLGLNQRSQQSYRDVSANREDY
jgi:hypothetical protein